MHPGLPPEVAILLPNQDGSRALLNLLETGGLPAGCRALGLFLADPFLRVGRVAAALAAAGVGLVAALPSVAQHDPELAQQLTDVGLDVARECARLQALKAQGLRTAAVATDAAAARLAAEADCDLVLVLPKVAQFAAGFPSLRQRGTAALAVREVLDGAGWHGHLLALADRTEYSHERLWPPGVDGVICRPEPLGDAGADAGRDGGQDASGDASGDAHVDASGR